MDSELPGFLAGAGLTLGDLLRFLFALMAAILFLQSGLDKVFNFEGNLNWLREHFAKSPLAGTVPAMLATITVVETTAGAFSGVGAVLVLVTGDPTVGFYGLLLAALATAMLFFGQRVSQDYEGAHVLINYFVFCGLGIALFGM